MTADDLAVMEAHATADASSAVVVAMKYPTNMTNTQWALVKAILAAEPNRKAIWREMLRSADARAWECKQQPLCNWCEFQSLRPPWNPAMAGATSRTTRTRTTALPLDRPGVG